MTERDPNLIPLPQAGDSDDVEIALETARSLWVKGDGREALRWLRRATDAAEQSGDDHRQLEIARRAADLSSLLGPSLAPAPAAQPPSHTEPPSPKSSGPQAELLLHPEPVAHAEPPPPSQPALPEEPALHPPSLRPTSASIPLRKPPPSTPPRRDASQTRLSPSPGFSTTLDGEPAEFESDDLLEQESMEPVPTGSPESSRPNEPTRSDSSSHHRTPQTVSAARAALTDTLLGTPMGAVPSTQDKPHHSSPTRASSVHPSPTRESLTPAPGRSTPPTDSPQSRLLRVSVKRSVRDTTLLVVRPLPEPELPPQGAEVAWLVMGELPQELLHQLEQ